MLQKLDAKEPVTVLVTGAAGQICYKLVTRGRFLTTRRDTHAASAMLATPCAC